MFDQKKVYSTIIFLMLIGTTSYAANRYKALTLEECISLALKNNFDLKIQKQTIKQAQAKSRQLKSSRFPRVDAAASYIRFSEVMEADIMGTISGFPFTIPPVKLRIGDEDNYALKLAITQPLFTGFKLSNNIKAKENQLRAEYFNERIQINNLIFKVKQTFYNLVTAQQSKQIARLSLHSVEAHLKDIKNMYTQGMIAKNEVLKAEIQKAEMELMLNQAENSIALIKNALLNLLGLALDTAIEVKEKLVYHSSPTRLSVALKTAFNKRPEITQLRYNINAMKHLVKASKGDYFPKISLIGTYEYGKPGLNKLENNWMDYWTIGIAAQWNIWDWGDKNAKVEQVMSSMKRLYETEQKIRRTIQLDVQQALLKKREAERRVDVYKKIKSQAEENFRLVSDQFHQGMVTNTEFLDAENQLTKAKIDELRAIADYNIAIANFERAIGNLVPKVD